MRPASLTRLAEGEARGPWLSYGVAAVAVGVCFAVRLSLQSVIGERTGFLFFIPAVMAGAALGGIGPALAAALLALLANYALAGPALLTQPNNVISAMVFLLVAIANGVAGAQLRRNARAVAQSMADLTERQDAERRLQALQAELAHMSRLTALGEMAAGLAHEVNQPLSAAANYVEGSLRLLEREPPDKAGMRAALTQAAEQARRAGQIIRRLREFVTRGEAERRIEPLPALLHEAGALAMVGVGPESVRLSFRIDPAVKLVLADRVQIQQVVVNLVRNALDATEDAPRRDIEVGAKPIGGMVEVCVADSGPGVSPAVVQHLFEPFITTKASGIGVGLSISRSIVEAHGGRIWAEPNPGGGAVFRFTLRAVSEEELAELE